MIEIIFDPMVPEEIFSSDSVDNSEKDLNAILSIVAQGGSTSNDNAATINSEKKQATRKRLCLTNDISFVLSE